MNIIPVAPIVIQQPYRASSQVRSTYSATTRNSKSVIKDALRHGIAILKNARKKTHADHKTLFQ